MAYKDYKQQNGVDRQKTTTTESNSSKESVVKNPDFTKCIKEGMTNESCEKIREKVETCFSSITTSQLRKFFSAVKLLQQRGVADSLSELIMLKPKLAYAVGRDKNNTNLKEFYEVMSKVIDHTYINIKDYKDKNQEKEAHNVAHNFIDLFEAIIAYHKFYAKQ